ncbi:hypothetical protein WA026_000035 [Henosepilachna vigintioctopunctata]|uniref:SLC26A/SulP transporter domain-containing protein n=2 Tax=Henosepilachna vigintioctopunctata TaxID=420089 RepID=A0AAW1V6A7_9CUCU
MGWIHRKLPILVWSRNYRLSYLFRDILAGFTVSLSEIPQAIAFAKIAGLDPVYGLYSGFMAGFVYCLFGTCKDLNIGPTSILALMIQSHVSSLGPNMAVLCTFTTGCVIFLLGLFNLGFIVEFFSYPVVAGFTSAGALQIAGSQLNSLFGIKRKASAFLESVMVVFKHLNEIQWTDTTLGICSIIFLVVLREFKRFGSLEYKRELSFTRNMVSITAFVLFLARNALVVIIGTILAYLIQNKDGKAPFEIVGKIGSALPTFKLPPFSTVVNGTHYDFPDMMKDFGTAVIFIPLVAILESVAIAKAFAGGKALDASQEWFAVGACNIMGSFVSSMPVTGSFTRSAVNNASGVITTFGGVITGICVLLSINYLISCFYYIPKATLASVLVCAMFYLFDFESFHVLWRTKKRDFLVLLITFLTCLLWSLENGILVGIFSNLLFVLYTTARPKFHLEHQTCAGRYIYLITPKTSILYPAAEYLRKDVEQNCTLEYGIVVLNGKNIGDMDATVARSIVELKKELELRKQTLLLLNFKLGVKTTLIKMDSVLHNYFVEGSIDSAIKDHEESSGYTSVSIVA